MTSRFAFPYVHSNNVRGPLGKVISNSSTVNLCNNSQVDVAGQCSGNSCISVTTDQRFPNVLHLRTPWQPISINCTLHIIIMFVINIFAVIKNSYIVTVNKQPNNVSMYVPLTAIIQYFFQVPLNILFRTSAGTRTPVWESFLQNVGWVYGLLSMFLV